MKFIHVICLLIISFSSSAATIVVTNSNDAGAGSLRDATIASTSGDIIDLTGVAGTITLTTGVLDCSGKDLEFIGPGAANLTISGNNASRIFHSFDGSIILRNLTLANGLYTVNPYSGGAAVANYGNGDVTIEYCIFINNNGASNYSRGGALDIANYDPLTWTGGTSAKTVNINYCQFENNSAYIGGAVVYRTSSTGGSTVNISNTTFKQNNNGLINGNDGGAFECAAQTSDVINFENCTFSDNSTVSTGGNSITGGAVSMGNGTFSFSSCSFVNNSSGSDGGALSHWGAGGCTLTNSLFQGNSAVTTGADLSGPFISGGFNMVATSTGFTGLSQPTDQLNSNALALPLANNGGFGETHAIDCSSPAIDAGGANPLLDQRDLPRVCDPDIGAFEYQTICNCTPGDTVYICSGDSLLTDGVYQSTPGMYGDTTLLIISSEMVPVALVCVSDPAFILTADSTGGIWSGTGITNATTGEFTPTIAGVGIHTITYEVQYTIDGTVYTCSSDMDIEVTEPMDATISPQVDLCQTDLAINLTAVDGGGVWTGTGISDQTLGTFDPGIAGVGTHTITYTITNGACGDIGTIDINVLGTDDASFTYPAASFCITDGNPLATVQGTAGGTFTISGAGTIDATTGTIDMTASGAGNYVVIYTTNGVCPATDSVDITIVDPVNITVDPAGPFCEDDPTSVLVTNGSGGTWSGIGVNPTTGEFDSNVAGVGTWEIIYTSPIQCGINADTISIVVNGLPTADAGVDQSILVGTTTSLSGSGGGTHFWEPPTGLSCTDCPDPTVNIDITTVYTLTVTNSEGCLDQDIVTITVIQEEQDLFIPNIFSPNGDNLNDQFVIEGTGLNNFLLRVFNRWGELVFESDDQSISWDGTQRDKELNTAVFAYVLTYIDDLGNVQRKTGNVTLVK